MEAPQDFPLPALAPHIKLSRAPEIGGEPSWTLHDPVANTYFKIDWMAFECLSRFHQYKTASSLKEAIECETTLSITVEQIADIVVFLQKSGLIILRDQKIQQRAPVHKAWWKTLLHTYLYVPIPLFRPQSFLEQTYPKISFLFSRAFLTGMMGLLILMILWTLPRLDEFFHTFNSFFSLEGIVSTLLTLSFVKVVHEWAHAFAAVRYGVKVPHMGVAFIVMYPVLYTETTGSWVLSSRRARFHIAVAGVMAELCLAAVFLGLWHIAPSGSIGQTICFLVVCVSLVSSLAVNLNPLMRFDGYYMLSDATGYDNLQTRACNFARYRLREILFGLGDEKPENLPRHDERFLTFFGFALLVYRFFLFLGIAILVYHVFFQPLGFFLMLVELAWFIALPIWSELKIWWEKRAVILASRRSFLPALGIGAVLLFILIPWKTTQLLPAVAHAGEYRAFYAPAASEIMVVQIEDNVQVKEGQVLAELRSPDLDMKLRKARHELEMLETLRRRAQSNPAAMLDAALSEAAIEKARVNVALLEQQQARLTITAPFDGVVRDMNGELQEGRYIRTDEKMFVLINPQSGTIVTAFATEEGQEDLRGPGTAEFFSADRKTRIENLSLKPSSNTGQTALDWPELSSLYGGPIASEKGPDETITARRPLYMVQTAGHAAIQPVVRTGYLKVASARQSIFINFIKWLGGLARQEAKLG